MRCNAKQVSKTAPSEINNPSAKKWFSLDYWEQRSEAELTQNSLLQEQLGWMGPNMGDPNTAPIASEKG